MIDSVLIEIEEEEGETFSSDAALSKTFELMCSLIGSMFEEEDDVTIEARERKRENFRFFLSFSNILSVSAVPFNSSSNYSLIDDGKSSSSSMPCSSMDCHNVESIRGFCPKTTSNGVCLIP